MIALPVFTLRLGLDDAGSDPTGSTTRQAYQALAKGFGPGFSGPLQLVGELQTPADETRLRDARAEDVDRTRGSCRPPRRG